MLFPSLMKDGNDDLFPQIHLHNRSSFFEDLTSKHFHDMAYKLHSLHTDLPTLHKQACFSTTIPPLSIYLECSPTQCVIKKVNNVAVKFVIFFQQLSSQDLCVNIAHIRSKTFYCVRKYIKFEHSER